MNTHVLSFDPVIPDPAISPKLEDNFSDVYAWGYLLQQGEKGSTLTIGKQKNKSAHINSTDLWLLGLR